jgi:16S rRNA (guanine(966)-N(2))-methyltransferase RsmD
MGAGLKIQQGRWKGKTISFPSSVKGNLQFTPSLLKKSLFGRIQASVLNDEISQESCFFIDLFAGSGQIGLEAISQGFENVVFFELDKKRFSELLSTYQEIGGAGKFSNTQFYHKDGFRYFSQWKGYDDAREIVYYLDPPYTFWNTIQPKILELITKIQTLELSGKKILLFIQSPEEVAISGMEHVEFGNNSLSYWSSFG